MWAERERGEKRRMGRVRGRENEKKKNISEVDPLFPMFRN